MMFRKKPVVIDAVQWEGWNVDEMHLFASRHAAHLGRVDGQNLIVSTLEGEMTASPGDWIIRGIKGEFYPCKPDIFAATYERVDGPARSPSELRALAVEIARRCAKAKPQSYYAEPFEPHEWVVDAILEAIGANQPTVFIRNANIGIEGCTRECCRNATAVPPQGDTPATG